MYFKKYFEEIFSLLVKVDSMNLQKMAEMILATNRTGGSVIIVGNGGSASIASHVAVDLTKAADIRSINFNEANLITCLANDFGYENWVSQALEYYASHNDLLVVISSSGQSRNMINAAKKAMSYSV
jgi:D-sedoheptulose 7-phosphate isomerase